MYTEMTPNGYGISIEKGNVLYSGKSDFQELEIFESRGLGRVFTLDGLMMTTERDEYFYHELITHIPMITHKNPENVLVIGGGDGGTIREVLKHKSVKNVDLCEIDGLVIDVCKKYLPTIAYKLDDPKVKIYVEDAIEFIKDKKNIYDVILIDSTDPMGPGEGLFTEEFYNNVKASLRPGGIVVPQSESPYGQKESFEKVYKLLRRVFKNVAPYCSPVITYPSGYWSWAFCSDDVEIPTFDTKLDENRASEIENTCKIYNSKLHKGVFAVPNFVKELSK